MQLKIAVRSGIEVKWTGCKQNGPVFYGGPPPETGEWKLSINKLEDYLGTGLRKRSFGSSIETFVLGFDIAGLSAEVARLLAQCPVAEITA
ncbi:hypothetical protein GTP23_01730 [Pseudoduganella sp. FT93W]|uniref:Uncharacterized protein n=1 Tax=Duganella fentianensis TaxID=2692177 RepID=A0A845HVT6_9BURK|nr:hypothetical protein [Duganella fentianensis]MYN43787.1 hypothetical protein [Duganella fentianensis]